MQPMTPEQMLSVAQVADILQMSGETIRRMIDDGDFPNARKLRPNLKTSPFRIPRSDVTAYQQRADSFPEQLGHNLAIQQVEGQTQD